MLTTILEFRVGYVVFGDSAVLLKFYLTHLHVLYSTSSNQMKFAKVSALSPSL